MRPNVEFRVDLPKTNPGLAKSHLQRHVAMCMKNHPRQGTMWVCLCWLKNSDFLEIMSDFVSFINWLVPNYFSETLPQQYFSKKFVVYSSLYLFALIENFWNFSIKFLEHTRISISISLLLILDSPSWPQYETILFH